MAMTRQEFCSAFAGATALLILQACGGGGDYNASPAPAPAAGCGASGAEIAGNHGHVLTIARADLDATTNQTYQIKGSAGHDHSVTFTPAQLQSLKAGSSVVVTSTDATLGPSHTHQVTASCM
jgi:hypothetical protein